MYEFFPQSAALGSAVLYVNDALAITPSTTLLRRKDNCRRISLLLFPSNPTLVCKEKKDTLESESGVKVEKEEDRERNT